LSPKAEKTTKNKYTGRKHFSIILLYKLSYHINTIYEAEFADEIGALEEQLREKARQNSLPQMWRKPIQINVLRNR